MARETLPIAREVHLPLGHLQVRVGLTACGSRFWSLWPDGPIGGTLERMIVNGFIDDHEALAGELEAWAAAVREIGAEGQT
jgi:hypothetical protein